MEFKLNISGINRNFNIMTWFEFDWLFHRLQNHNQEIARENENGSSGKMSLNDMARALTTGKE